MDNTTKTTDRPLTAHLQETPTNQFLSDAEVIDGNRLECPPSAKADKLEWMRKEMHKALDTRINELLDKENLPETYYIQIDSFEKGIKFAVLIGKDEIETAVNKAYNDADCDAIF